MFMALKNEREGVVDAEIASAFPLDDAQLATLVNELGSAFSSKVKPTVAVDQELIGGVKVAVGDEVIDGSVRGKLAAMAAALRQGLHPRIGSDHAVEPRRDQRTHQEQDPEPRARRGHPHPGHDRLGDRRHLPHPRSVGRDAGRDARVPRATRSASRSTSSATRSARWSWARTSTSPKATPSSAPAGSCEVPVGQELIGRVVNALGEPIDGKGPINAKVTESSRRWRRA